MAKAISIQEPYASLIAEGVKGYETRSKWNYKYRGEIYIHASAKIYDPKSDKTRLLLGIVGNDIHPGCIVAKATLVAVYDQTEEMIQKVKREMPIEHMTGFYEAGRKILILKNIRKLKKPFPAKGHLGIWEFDDTALIEAQYEDLAPVINRLYTDGYDDWADIREELDYAGYESDEIEYIARKVMDMMDKAAGHY